MKYACLAFGLMFGVVACGRGGSAKIDGGGGAAGLAQGGEASSQGGSSATEGNGSESSGGGQPATTAGTGATGGTSSTPASATSTGGSSGIVVAGAGAVAGQNTAGQRADQDGGSSMSCGVQVVNAARTTPDVLLVLDRSASMDNSIAEDRLCKVDAGATCKSRWSTLRSALTAAIADTPDLRWGLKLFPTKASGSCAVSPDIEVPIGAGSVPAIVTAMAAATPEGNTPTRVVIQAAANYLKTVDDQNSKVILLATDGLPNCLDSRTISGDDLPATAAAIENAGFPVYVVGIGPEQALMSLEMLSQAGGTGHYLPATSPDELTAALTSIADTVASCTFKLSVPAPFLGSVTVALDQVVLAKDDVNGWGFAGDSRTIEVHGDACTKLKTSPTSTLAVRVDCR
jgi:Mg-chelatase subunit ChlD